MCFEGIKLLLCYFSVRQLVGYLSWVVGVDLNVPPPFTTVRDVRASRFPALDIFKYFFMMDSLSRAMWDSKSTTEKGELPRYDES